MWENPDARPSFGLGLWLPPNNFYYLSSVLIIFSGKNLTNVTFTRLLVTELVFSILETFQLAQVIFMLSFPTMSKVITWSIIFLTLGTLAQAGPLPIPG